MINVVADIEREMGQVIGMIMVSTLSSCRYFFSLTADCLSIHNILSSSGQTLWIFNAITDGFERVCSVCGLSQACFRCIKSSMPLKCLVSRVNQCIKIDMTVRMFYCRRRQ